jgi:hypothetical protein
MTIDFSKINTDIAALLEYKYENQFYVKFFRCRIHCKALRIMLSVVCMYLCVCVLVGGRRRGEGGHALWTRSLAQF